jgi:hypothetical protein
VERPEKTRFGLGKVDLLLIGVSVILFVVGALLLWLSPTGWSCYLWLLDVRIWPPWKCLGAGVVLLETLLLIRYWPN